MGYSFGLGPWFVDASRTQEKAYEIRGIERTEGPMPFWAVWGCGNVVSDDKRGQAVGISTRYTVSHASAVSDCADSARFWACLGFRGHFPPGSVQCHPVSQAKRRQRREHIAVLPP